MQNLKYGSARRSDFAQSEPLTRKINTVAHEVEILRILIRGMVISMHGSARSINARAFSILKCPLIKPDNKQSSDVSCNIINFKC